MLSSCARVGRQFCAKGFTPQDLRKQGIVAKKVLRNIPVPKYYQEDIANVPEGSNILPGCISSTGAFVAYSGAKTGRSPADKRIVEPDTPEEDRKIWWGSVNKKLSRSSYDNVLKRAKDYLSSRDQLYVVDGFVGWDPKYRKAVRVICTRPYHALFMHNMLIRPSPKELAESFSNPEFVIYNAGQLDAEPGTTQGSSKTCIALDVSRNTAVILGSQYAGEMKKGLFTMMHYWMPDLGVLSLHSSCNEGIEKGDVTLLFGLSGTGKTTLSADPKRRLIGDDEHCWTKDGVFNIEGGCYAKCIGLDETKEPEIFNAIKFGSVLENVLFKDQETGEVDYDNVKLTQNTRCSYPLEYIPGAKIPAVGGHPKNIIFLTCDANGVLPPVSKLNSLQCMYHFISGYTANMAGVLAGDELITPTFSACFGEAFLPRHPTLYAEMLEHKVKKYDANVWLLNTGWINGKYGAGGKRISIKHTRAIIDAIHSGELEKAEYTETDIFKLKIPKAVSGIPTEILDPAKSWTNKADFDHNLVALAKSFKKNFEKYKNEKSDRLLAGGPQLS